MGDKVATRKAYGDALAALGTAGPRSWRWTARSATPPTPMSSPRRIPERYFEMFIAEQQMVAAAVGLSVRHYVPFASTFAAFFTRAYDFIRMAAISQANIRLAGSHAGVEIGADGPSQMALEDLAMMRAIRDQRCCTRATPTSTAALVREMADRPASATCGPPAAPIRSCTTARKSFPVGGSKVLRSGPDDAVTLIGAGVTLHACLAAADLLAGDGIQARVIDLYSVAPIDTETLVAAVAATSGRLVVAEDHYPAGGLGSAVSDALLAAGSQPLHLAHLCRPGAAGFRERH